MIIGYIFKIHSDFYYIKTDENIYECKLRDVLKKQKVRPFVGDFVEFKNGYIQNILPRKSYIPRPSVANITQVVIVSAVKEPDLNFEQLNRYIALANYYNLPVKLCFNKSDLSENDNTIEEVFSIYEPLGYDIIFTSALEKIMIEDFIELLEGETTVLCGNSGAGKTSLINAISPNLSLRTKQVSKKTSRGVHTTRHCEIIEIKKGLNIVDTPGFSNLKFDFILPTEVDKLFPEIKNLSDSCKYTDCLHINEDFCNVLANIDSIAPSRYESYLAFVEEAKTYKELIKYNGVKTENFSKKQYNRTFTKISAKKREGARNTKKQNMYKEFEDE